MANFLLVHGAWHGAWCWGRLVSELTTYGHRAVAIDLPGGGDDLASPSTVSIEDYKECVGKQLRKMALSDGRPVHLVGHSTGGVAVSCAAEAWPERIARSYYLSAIMICSGQSLLDESLKHNSSSGLLQEGVIDVDEQGSVVRYYGKDSEHILYGECDDDARAFARENLRVEQPLGPWTSELRLTESAYGTVPRSYIRTLRDRTVTPEFQDGMIRASTCDHVAHLDTDHGSFLSRPRELANILHDTAIHPRTGT